MENKVGGEARLIDELGLKAEIKYVKRAGNEAARDERHAPLDPKKLRKLTSEERAKAIKDTHKILRAYEDWVQREP
jgi:hypothetical protein